MKHLIGTAVLLSSTSLMLSMHPTRVTYMMTNFMQYTPRNITPAMLQKSLQYAKPNNLSTTSLEKIFMNLKTQQQLEQFHGYLTKGIYCDPDDYIKVMRTYASIKDAINEFNIELDTVFKQAPVVKNLAQFSTPNTDQLFYFTSAVEAAKFFNKFRASCITECLNTVQQLNSELEKE